MPELSRFFGLIIKIYAYDNARHYEKHIHAEYQEHEASLRISDGEVLAGFLPSSKLRLVQAWIEIHRDELEQAWNLAVSGQKPPKIQPLR